MQRLDDALLHARLAQQPGWALRAGKLSRELRFADFRAAFAFMTAVADEAEAMNHHPDWSNVYDRVRIELSTHDAGGITEQDFALAAAIDRLALAHGAHAVHGTPLRPDAA